MKIILWRLLLFLIQFSGYFCNVHPCLTWEMRENELKIIYMTDNFSSDVTFYDNKRSIRGFCDFNTTCYNIKIMKDKHEVILVLKEFKVSDIDGEWSCQQGFDTYTTHVSSSGDIYTSTHLNIDGSLIHRQNRTFIQIKCSSCRKPFGYRAQFLQNNRLGDIVTFNLTLNVCFNGNGQCNASSCSCSSVANEFTRIYEKDGESQMTFACAMKFKTTSQTFIKVSSLVYDGRQNFTITEIKRTTPALEVSTNVSILPSEEQHTEKAYFALLLLLFIPAISYCYWKRKRQQETGKKKTEEENIPMLVLEKCENTENDERNDAYKRWLFLNICLHSYAIESLRMYTERFVEGLYNIWVKKVGINNQSFKNHIAYYNHIILNYSAINSNSGKDRKCMDYRVNNYIEFSKLFLQKRLTSFDDLDSLLEIVSNINEFPPIMKEHTGKLTYNVLKPCKRTHHIDVRTFEIAIETMDGFIRSMNSDQLDEFKLCTQYGLPLIDEEFINGIKVGNVESFKTASSILKEKVKPYTENQSKVEHANSCEDEMDTVPKEIISIPMDGKNGMQESNIQEPETTNLDRGEPNVVDIGKIQTRSESDLTSSGREIKTHQPPIQTVGNISPSDQTFKQNNTKKKTKNSSEIYDNTGNDQSTQFHSDYHSVEGTSNELSGDSVDAIHDNASYTSDSGYGSFDSKVSYMKENIKQMNLNNDGQKVREEDDKIRKEVEFDIAKMFGVDDLEEYHKRWIIFGMCLQSVLHPIFRKLISEELQLMYQDLNAKKHLDSQVYPNYLQSIHSYKLNYTSINDNEQKGWMYRDYNYKVMNGVDLSKLFLPTHLANYYDFNSSFSLSAAFCILLNSNLSGNATQLIYQVKVIRNRLAHNNYQVWDEQLYASSFDDIAYLIKCLSIPTKQKEEALKDLNRWKEYGQMFQQRSLGLELVDEVRDQIPLFVQCTSNLAHMTSRQVEEQHYHFRSSVEQIENSMMYEKLPDALRSLLKTWEEEETLYAETRAGDQIEKLVRLNSCVTITGPPGCGKSFTMRHVAHLCRYEFDLVPILVPSDLQKYYKEGKKTLFLVDDLCGKFYCNYQNIQEWQQQMAVVNTITQNSDCKIIACCRLHIYRDDRFKTLYPFMSCEFNMTNLPLNLDEGSEMIKKYTQQKLNPNELEWVYSRSKAVFPLLCRLYKSKQENKSILKFFTDPSSIFENEFDILSNSDDICKNLLCAMCIVVIHNNRVDKMWLKEKSTSAQEDLMHTLSDALALERRITKAKLIKALNTLQGTFVNQYVRFYEAVNDSIFDVLVNYFCKRCINCIIEYAVPNFIHERLSWQSRTRVQHLVYIPSESANVYLQRLVKEWENGNVVCVFNNRSLMIEEARKMLISHLNYLDDSLIRNIVNITDISNEQSITPLIQASRKGFHDLVEWLIANKANINSKDKNGMSALAWAYRNEDLEMMFTLVSNNADCNVSDEDGNTLLHWACRNDNFDFTKLLIEKGEKPYSQNDNGDSLLYNACLNSNVKLVELLLENKANFNTRTTNQTRSLLSISNHEITQLLINYLGVNIVDRFGKTPLYWATYNGDIGLTKLILENKDCEVNRADADGTTPLHIACYKRHKEIVSILLDRKAKIDVCNSFHATPLYYSCLQEGLDSPIEIVQLLLSANADINVQVLSGETVFALAILNGYSDVAELLLEARAYGIYTTDHIAKNVDSEKLKTLRNNIRMLLLRKIPKEWTAHGVLLSDTAWDIYTGSSPLHLSCLFGNFAVTNLLLNAKVLVNVQKENGASPLFYACQFGHYDIVKLLLENGADMSVSVEGKSLSNIAKDNGHTRIVQYLSNCSKSQKT